jgi:hypothetical protein
MALPSIVPIYIPFVTSTDKSNGGAVDQNGIPLAVSWKTCRNRRAPVAIIQGYSPTQNSRNCDGAAEELRLNWIGSACGRTMRKPRERKGRAHLLPAAGSARTSPSVSFQCVLELLDD